MKRSTLVLGVSAIAVAVFAGGAALYTRSGPATAPGLTVMGGQAETPAVAPEGSPLVRPHSPVLGEANAPVTIVEFFDPACEACRAMYPRVKATMAQHPGQVRLVLRYTPFHSGSEDAIRILEAARAQGRLEPVLEALLEKQQEWAGHDAPSTARAWEIAAEAGLDLKAGQNQAVAPSVDALLQQDVADVRAMNIRSTPTFFVNGKTLQRFGPAELSALVASEVAAVR